MTAWLFLAGAILTEVTATLSLRAAVGGGDSMESEGSTRRRRGWYAVVAAGYVSAFSLLSLSLGAGMPLGIAYGVWAAAGVAITAVASALLFKEPFTVLMATGIALIMGGVLLVELGAAP
ncbi:QacE family quaternary ammonium compound efflux SMR transporter [Labedella populi]|uniref:QacE family quaternary ammonium compound efflux SMR transporter n=1 Tax=Labedella populi TaxID=2498850 RepID=A0A3S4ECP3_9MICO|nr:SMR family transporter [Labedella populi]RWZ68277.1 QacE family quaternary ammonium compound efflux SMR transporter [Labedella populi]